MSGRTDRVVIKLVVAILSYPPFYVCIPTACLSQDGVSDDMKYIRTLGYKIRFLDQGLFLAFNFRMFTSFGHILFSNLDGAQILGVRSS